MRSVSPETFESTVEFCSSALIAAWLSFGCACRSSAAAPAVCGDAIEVPCRLRLPVPVPTPAETIETPGADRSGLNVEPPWPGPREENVAI